MSMIMLTVLKVTSLMTPRFILVVEHFTYLPLTYVVATNM